jgi:hypothetical protein
MADGRGIEDLESLRGVVAAGLAHEVQVRQEPLEADADLLAPAGAGVAREACAAVGNE